MKCSTVCCLLALSWVGWAMANGPLAEQSTADHTIQARAAPAPQAGAVGLREWIKTADKQPDALAAPFRLSEPQRQHLREQLRVPFGQTSQLR